MNLDRKMKLSNEIKYMCKNISPSLFTPFRYLSDNYSLDQISFNWTFWPKKISSRQEILTEKILIEKNSNRKRFWLKKVKQLHLSIFLRQDLRLFFLPFPAHSHLPMGTSEPFPLRFPFFPTCSRANPGFVSDFFFSEMPKNSLSP